MTDITVGSLVKVKPGARTYTGKQPVAFIFKGTYRVDEIKGDKAILDKNGICSQYKLNDLMKHPV